MNNSINPAPKTFTRPAETAEVLKISSMTLHRWCKQPNFPQPLRRGQVVLYDVAAITAWLEGGV